MAPEQISARHNFINLCFVSHIHLIKKPVIKTITIVKSHVKDFLSNVRSEKLIPLFKAKTKFKKEVTDDQARAIVKAKRRVMPSGGKNSPPRPLRGLRRGATLALYGSFTID